MCCRVMCAWGVQFWCAGLDRWIIRRNVLNLLNNFGTMMCVLRSSMTHCRYKLFYVCLLYVYACIIICCTVWFHHRLVRLYCFYWEIFVLWCWFFCWWQNFLSSNMPYQGKTWDCRGASHTICWICIYVLFDVAKKHCNHNGTLQS